MLGMQIPTKFLMITQELLVQEFCLKSPLLKKKSRTGAELRLLGAHPESGVEVDVICAAHVLVLFFCTVQSSDTDGSSPVYKARNGTLSRAASTTPFHLRQHLHEHQLPQ